MQALSLQVCYALRSSSANSSSSVPHLQVLGGVESRGVLKKISDMLEVILKRIDNLSKLDNTSTTEARRLDELSSAISRYAHFSLCWPDFSRLFSHCIATYLLLSPPCGSFWDGLLSQSPSWPCRYPFTAQSSSLCSLLDVVALIPVIFKRSEQTRADAMCPGTYPLTSSDLVKRSPDKRRGSDLCRSTKAEGCSD